jgi:hypothetical protein
MRDLIFDALVVASVLGATYLLVSRRATGRNGLPYPPGPSRLPFIGNLLDIPLAQEWITFQNWGHKYGMFSFLGKSLKERLLMCTIRDRLGCCTC